MKYYIIAGEASGDLHGSNLIRVIKEQDPQSQIRAWGGDLMAKQGAEVVKHYRDLAFMGFVEVLFNIKTIIGNMSFCKKDIENFAPDAVIFIDYPGFNLNIASWCHKKGFKTFYYISPQVWAWKEGRVKTIKKNIDHMLVILPFEKAFFQKHNYNVDYVGHPLLDALEQRHAPTAEEFQKLYGLDSRPVIALLPGSRSQEIKAMLPTMCTLPALYPQYQFILAAAPSHDEDFYKKIIGSADVKILAGQTYQILSAAHAALVTSGTATLETALIGTPQVVCYKGSPISYWIGRMVVKVKYISLVNLIADAPVVKELIQDDFNRSLLRFEFEKILHGEYREKMLHEYAQIRHTLGDGGASKRAAQLIIRYLQEK
ncbi:MAG: lipid-A-disaccharide synthase [Flavobacteriales bacterium]|nr:lipid-A-disaccharide synthase [Flavobacteriales bacterium]